MKTIFSLHKIFNYKNHVIRAEKRSLFFTMEYSLIIDDKKLDQIFGTYGILTMYGHLDDDNITKPVKIVMKQRVFSTDFYCMIDNELHKMSDFEFENIK